MIELGNWFFRSSRSLQQPPTLLESLEELARDLNGCDVEWMLVGGVGTALYHGEIYRDHGDFDVSVEVGNVPALTACLSDKGYFLCQRLPLRGRRFLPVTIFRRIETAQCTLTTRSLCFFNPSKEQPLLQCVDLKLESTVGDQTRFHYRKKDYFFTGSIYGKTITVGGQSIVLRHPRVHRELLDDDNKNLKKHAQDKAVLEKRTDD